MKCLKCDGSLRTVDSRKRVRINARYRRKKCVDCGSRFVSLEVIVEPISIQNERLMKSSVEIPLHLSGLAIGQIAYVKDMIKKFEKDNQAANWFGQH